MTFAGPMIGMCDHRSNDHVTAIAVHNRVVLTLVAVGENSRDHGHVNITDNVEVLIRGREGGSSGWRKRKSREAIEIKT